MAVERAGDHVRLDGWAMTKYEREREAFVKDAAAALAAVIDAHMEQIRYATKSYNRVAVLAWMDEAAGRAWEASAREVSR